MSQLLYYLIIKPLSLLPMWILHRFSDVVFVLMYYIFPYRKKLVINNMTQSFPEKTPKEIRQIARKFYRHLCDLIFESIRAFSMSKEEARRRCKPVDMEVINRLQEEKRSVIIAGGHHNSWEMAAMRFDEMIPHRTMGIYAPLKNDFLNRKLQESRAKMGMYLLPLKEVRATFEREHDQQIAVIIATDQSPSRNAKKYYRTQFLNQETAVLYGTEKFAKQYDLPIVFTHIYKIKRGYYTFKLEWLENDPNNTKYGEITEKHVRLLEKRIKEKPEYWLWTHNRWKLKLEA